MQVYSLISSLITYHPTSHFTPRVTGPVHLCAISNPRRACSHSPEVCPLPDVVKPSHILSIDVTSLSQHIRHIPAGTIRWPYVGLPSRTLAQHRAYCGRRRANTLCLLGTPYIYHYTLIIALHRPLLDGNVYRHRHILHFYCSSSYIMYNSGIGRLQKGMDDPISVHNRFESMDCSHEADSSDSEVFVSPDTVAALQAQIKPGRHKNS